MFIDSNKNYLEIDYIDLSEYSSSYKSLDLSYVSADFLYGENKSVSIISAPIDKFSSLEEFCSCAHKLIVIKEMPDSDESLIIETFHDDLLESRTKIEKANVDEIERKLIYCLGLEVYKKQFLHKKIDSDRCFFLGNHKDEFLFVCEDDLYFVEIILE